jgi:hypothetical protein
MIPAKFGPLLFGAILSGLMSLLVSGVSTFRSIGPASGFLPAWIGNWLAAWLLAFPVVLLVAPLARKLVQRLTASQATQRG